MKKSILMTGAAAGSGQTIYNKLKELGHDVFGLGLGGPDEECDLRTPFSDYFVDTITEHGPFDVLLNHAGIMELNRFQSYTHKQLVDSMAVNFFAPLLLMQAFIGCHEKGGCWPGGVGTQIANRFRIISTTSMITQSAARCCVGYGASKAALEHAMKALAREMGKTEFIFASIAPAGVEDTGMQSQGVDFLERVRGFSRTEAETYLQNYPAGRLITHEELFQVVEFAIDLPAAMSGTVLRIPLASGL